MIKRIVWITVGIVSAAIVGFTAFGIINAKKTAHTFDNSGYMLMGDKGTVDQKKTVDVPANGEYTSAGDGLVTFKSGDGETMNVSEQSFVYYDDGSVAALCDGFLLDFNDLSENFINNYCISANIPLRSEGGTYTADTASGTMNFGEHLWKLSDLKYLIQSPKLTVSMSENDTRPCEEFVQVAVTDDGIVQLLTKDNLWMTISDTCCIETDGGVKIYPVAGYIDNGKYKMSLGKLSVDVNDGIVLAAAAQKETLIPKFNINTEDGEDGEAGEAGTAGTGGTKGSDGDQGAGGDDGDDGSAGSTGSSGSTGSTGGTPVSARDGVDAEDVTTTKSSVPVMQLVDWEVTTTSLRGTINVTDESGFLADLEEAQKLAYPGSVTIINKDTGEEYPCYESYSASYTPLQDTGFKRFNEDGTPPVYFSTSNADKTTINILEPDTNYILSVKAYYNVSGTIFQREFIRRSFCTDTSGVFLADESRTTDSVTVNVDVNDIYWSVDPVQRGIDKAVVYLLTMEQAENFDYSLATSQGFNGYLFRYEVDYKQNNIQGYRPDKVPPILSSDVVEQTHPLVFGGIDELRLDSDTQYVARVIISRDAMVSLSPQELVVETLKTNPTYYDGTDIKDPGGNDEFKSVRSVYNRVTDCFEVYRPTIKDPDNGIVNYKYTVYKREKTATGEYEYTELKNKAQELTGSEPEPVQFFIPTGTENEYVFKVVAEFFDNEKTVYYELGDSGVTYAVGSGLPKVVKLNETLRDNFATGTISISLDDAGTLQKNFESLGHQLTFRLYNDQWYDGSMSFKGTNRTYDKKTDAPKVNGVGYSLYDCKITATDVQISYAFYNLRFNTDYSLDVTGAVDLGDGSGEQERLLGTIRFSTKVPPAVTTKFTQIKPSSETFNVSISVSIESEDDVKDQSGGVIANALPYDISEIRKGRTVLKLYEGTGTGGTQLGDQYVLQNEDLVALTSDAGFSVTPTKFGTNLAGETGKDYTISIFQMTEGSYYNKELTYKYINEYTKNLSQSYFTVAAEIAPPSLPTEPAGGVHAEPIYAADASLYTDNTSVYSELSDDTVIGFTLDPTYTNDTLLGRKITYYAYEYTDFYDALRGYDRTAGAAVLPVDPVGKYDIAKTEEGPKTVGKDKLMTISIDMNKLSTDVPKAAILFGGTKAEDTLVSFSNGYYVYYAGEPVIEKASGGGVDYVKLKSGMGRGFRYVFAYTLEYELAGFKLLYPYDHSDYGKAADVSGEATGYVKDYGIGHQIVSYERGSWKYTGPSMFTGSDAVAYILNSGLQDAPMEEPVFHTYLRKSSVTGWAAASGADKPVTRSGELGYSYEDPDQVIGWETYSEKEQSEITGHNSGTQYINVQPNEGDDVHWGSVGYTATVPKGGSDVNISVSRRLFSINYDDLLKVVAENTPRAAADSTSMKMGHVLNEWSYSLYYNGNNTVQATAPDPTMTVEQTEGYYIDFVAGNPTMESIASRGFAVKIRLTDKTDSKNYYEAILPIKYNDGNHKTYYARISTTSLPASLIGKEFTASGEIYYDSGDAGWYYADPESDPHADKDGDVAAAVRYGMQYMTDTNGSFTWSRYFKSGNEVYETGEVPSGGMFISSEQSAVLPDGIVPTIESLYSKTTSGVKQRNRFKMRYAFSTLGYAGYSDFDLYLYPYTAGVEASNSPKINAPILTNYLVPKKLIAKKIGFSESGGGGGGGGGTVTYIVPEVNYSQDNIMTTGTAIWLDRFSLNNVVKSKAHIYPAEETGLKEDCYVVSVGLYDSINQAESHSVRSGEPGSVSERFFAVNESGQAIAICTEYDESTGTYITWDAELDKWFLKDGKNYPTFTGVNSKESYYVGFSMKMPDGTSTYKSLLDHDRVAQSASYTKAVYQTETQGPVTVKINLVRYDYKPDEADLTSGFGYFNKQLYSSFALSRTTGLEMRYEIYTDENDAKPTYDDQGMVTNWTDETRERAWIDFSKTQGLVAGATLSKKANITKINVSPYMFRTEVNKKYTEFMVEGVKKYRSLVPGTKYYLRINAVEGGVCMGSDYVAFSIPKAQGYITPTIFAPDRDSSSLTFSVSCYDAISSAMGYHQGTDEVSALPENVAEKGLYTVRFGYYRDDQSMVHIPTVYDKQVYSMGGQTVKQRFELKNSNIKGSSYTLKPDTLYWIAVYAVNDADLKGLSYPLMAAESEGREWEYFFKTAKEDAAGSIYYAPVFTDFVDSFFDDTSHVLKADMAVVEARYAVGSYSTKTTDDSNIYIGNREFMRVDGKESGLRLKLTDSAGIIDRYGHQAFVRIDCTAQKIGGGTATVSITDQSKMFTYDKADEAYILDMDFVDEQFAFSAGDRYNFTMKLYTDTSQGRVYDIAETNVKLE